MGQRENKSGDWSIVTGRSGQLFQPAPATFSADAGLDIGHDSIPRGRQTGTQDDRTTWFELPRFGDGLWLRPIDPAMADGREVPYAQADSHGALSWADGAIPVAGPETGGLSITVAADRWQVVAPVGAAENGD